MAREIKIPSLGESVTEATLGRWLKEDGDAVAADEPVLELESDKANMELAAEAAGRLRILTPAGATVHFGDVVGSIEEGAATAAGARAEHAIPAGEQAPAPATPTPGVTVAPPPSTATRPEAVATPTAAPAKAAFPAAEGPGYGTPPTAGERPLSPAVRRIVEEEKLDVAGVRGSGPGGRLLKGDVLELAQQRAAAGGAGAPAAAASPAGRASVTPLPTAAVAAGTVTAASATTAARPAPAPAARGEERVPMSRLRQVIARRLVESQQTTATLTTFNEVDMSAVLELRAHYKEAFQKKHGIGLGFMSFFVAACCDAMREVPEANARIEGTDIVYSHDVHVGVAVGTERGLVVPVVRNADRLGFAEIEREIARLAQLARDGKLMPDDLSGATFTISNGGIYGSLLSTPILNPPQSSILGMHKIEKRAVVVENDQIAVRPMMYLALSYDHRLIDGQGAVTYLVRVKERLEDPTRLLLRV